MKRLRAIALLAVMLFGAFSTALAEDDTPRVIVVDFTNSAKDRRIMTARIASDTVATEINRRKLGYVVSRPDVDHVAHKLGMRPPYQDDDLIRIAREMDVTRIVTGEVKYTVSRIRDRRREYEVGLVVRVRNVTLDELTNGAAERAVAIAPEDGSKTEAELYVEAAGTAANHAVAKLASYTPIVGTIMNSEGLGSLVINRGFGNGVKTKQDFIVFRNGQRVAHIRTGRVFNSYSELSPIDNAGGIQPGDQVIAIFPEPKFGK